MGIKDMDDAEAAPWCLACDRALGWQDDAVGGADHG